MDTTDNTGTVGVASNTIATPERLSGPTEAPADPGASRAPHATPKAATRAAETHDEALTPDAPLSDERLAEIEARTNAATDGPWHVEDDRQSLTRLVVSDDRILTIDFGYVGNRTQDDAQFVAHALEDVTALLAEVRRLRARVRELERPAVEAKRNEIRQSFADLIAAAEETKDYEGAFDVQCRLREREEQWKAEDAADQPAADTLPAWLYQRFAHTPNTPAWDALTDEDRAYWEHQAAAVRRAVARGGFKTTAEETHVVADDSNDPEHVDDCPGCATAPDFFQAGHTYTYAYWQFRCDAVTTHPGTGRRVALGWFRTSGGEWRPFNSTEDEWAEDAWKTTVTEDEGATA